MGQLNIVKMNQVHFQWWRFQIFVTVGFLFTCAADPSYGDVYQAPPKPNINHRQVTSNNVQLYWSWGNFSSVGGTRRLLIANECLVERSLESDPNTWFSSEFELLLNTEEHVRLNVTNLTPYTNYQFRLTINGVSSMPSLSVRTKGRGRPGSPPRIVWVRQAQSRALHIKYLPPEIPNGKITSFELIYKSVGKEQSQPPVAKEIYVQEEEEDYAYLTEKMACNTTYSIQLKASNMDGTSDSASSFFTTTCPPVPNDENTDDAPYALFMMDTSIFKKDLREKKKFIKHQEISQFDELIAGFDIHYEYKLLFVVTVNGTVYRESIVKGVNGTRDRTELARSQDIDSGSDPVEGLMVDWLNNKLYLLHEQQLGFRGNNMDGDQVWYLRQCDLDGQNCKRLAYTFQQKPLYTQVDPYHGYVFWVEKNNYSNSESKLIRLNITQDETKCRQIPEIVFRGKDLGPFVISFTNFSIFVPVRSENRLYEVSLSSPEFPHYMRHLAYSETAKFGYQDVKSIAFFNNKFYWMTDEGFNIEYCEEPENYCGFSLVDNTLWTDLMKLYYPSAQPFPVPINTVESLQVIFNSSAAKVSWIEPVAGFQTSCASYQSWTYDVQFLDVDEEIISTIKTVENQKAHVENNLMPGKLYRVRVRAASRHGAGPWSATFSGTAMKDGSTPRILWSDNKFLHQMDIFGGDGRSIVNLNSNLSRITGLAWDKESKRILWSSNKSLFCQGNNKLKVEVIKLDQAKIGGLAYEPLGQKIYYSKQNMFGIQRLNSSGEDELLLPVNSLATNLVVDSEMAKLCWITVINSLECSLLDGSNKTKLYEIPIGEERRIIAATTDANAHHLYFIISNPSSYPKYEYHKIDLQNYEHVPLGPIETSHIEPPLHYISDKLMFLENKQFMVTYDIQGKSFSKVKLSENSLYFTAIQNFTMQGPSEEKCNTKPRVVPNPVDDKSIGFKNDNGVVILQWAPVTNTNLGMIKYRVILENSNITSDHPFVSFQNASFFQPYSTVDISIVAFTIWSESAASYKRLITPEEIPEAPVNLRAFWSLGKEGNATFFIRWDDPLKSNGKITHFVLRCRSSHTKQDFCLGYTVPNRENSLKLDLPNGMHYEFSIAAVNGAGQGPYSVHFKTHSIVESNPVPMLMIGVDYPAGINIIDLDLNNKLDIPLLTAPAHVNYLASLNKIFSMDEKGQMMVINATSKKASDYMEMIPKIQGTAIDYMGRFLFVSEDKAIHRIDLDKSGQQPILQKVFQSKSKIKSIETNALAGKMLVTTISDSTLTTHEYKLGIDGHLINGTKIHPVKDDNFDSCTCSMKMDIAKIVYASFQKYSYIVHDMELGIVSLTDKNFCSCLEIFRTRRNVPVEIKLDASNAFLWTPGDFKMTYVNLLSSKHSSHIFEKIPTSIGTLCTSCIAKKDLSCWKLKQDNVEIVESSIHEDSADFILPLPSNDCDASRPLPSTRYVIRYVNEITHESHQDFYYNEGNALDRLKSIKFLHPFSNYSVSVKMENIYSNSDYSEKHFFFTDEGPPNAPSNVSTNVVSPEEIRLSWNAPNLIRSHNVSYEVFWESEDGHQSVKHKDQNLPQEEHPKTAFNFTITNLEPSTSYSIWVVAKSTKGKFDNRSMSSKIISKTFSRPQQIKILEITSRSIDFSWNSQHSEIEKHQFFIYSAGKEKDMLMMPSQPVKTSKEAQYSYHVTGLSPGSCYLIKARVWYRSHILKYYTWSGDNDACYKTEKDQPLVPGIPYVASASYDIQRLTLEWFENDKDIEQYELQLRPHSSQDSEWISHVRKENTFEMTASFNESYAFRVRAKNKFGWSNFSAVSEWFSLDGYYKPDHNKMVITITSCSIIAFIFIVLLIFHYFIRPRLFGIEKKSKLNYTYGTDVQLASLRELPMRAGFIDRNNPIYEVEPPTDEELACIPKMDRSQITLTRFLGSGAFGEVYEGYVVVNGMENSKENRIAIKTLRMGASDNEKSEFLKEAKLMWNFKHDNILDLIAICLENNFLILELMEGGDLLTYLRNNRPKGFNRGIPLCDLVQMCLDVAKGCEYLEQMHYVHRDLAARNCLVSSLDSEKRTVKIGDFGLARDIYKNDYYRKDGEALLPVRWMAPESLSDGVFTTQSDVWSFGVLLWEIVTLGGKPYPAMANREVLVYVRTGGRLEFPQGSPERLNQLMNKCWSCDPLMRPSFKQCVLEIDTLLTYDPSLNHLSHTYIPFNNNHGCVNSCSHYNSATTVPISQLSRGITSSSGLGSIGSPTPNYLQLIHEEYGANSSRTGSSNRSVEGQLALPRMHAMNCPNNQAIQQHTCGSCRGSACPKTRSETSTSSTQNAYQNSGISPENTFSDDKGTEQLASYYKVPRASTAKAVLQTLSQAVKEPEVTEYASIEHPLPKKSQTANALSISSPLILNLVHNTIATGESHDKPMISSSWSLMKNNVKRSKERWQSFDDLTHGAAGHKAGGMEQRLPEMDAGMIFSSVAFTSPLQQVGVHNGQQETLEGRDNTAYSDGAVSPHPTVDGDSNTYDIPKSGLRKDVNGSVKDVTNQDFGQDMADEFKTKCEVSGWNSELIPGPPSFVDLPVDS